MIDLEEKTVALDPHQGFMVPKGVLHRTRAPEQTAVLKVEQASVKPTGIRRVRLYPASLLITVAVLLPNLLLLALPPRNVQRYGESSDSLALTIVERVGQVSCFVLPLFFPLSFTGSLVITAWIVMGVTLGFYYAGWVRFFVQGRDYALLFKPMLGLPVPMAISPVIYFLFASLVLGSVFQAIAAAVLGVGHITISIHESRRISVALVNRP